MADRWKPLPASAYKEDFRLRTPSLPQNYTASPPRPARHRTTSLPDSRANFTNVEKVLWPQEGYTKTDVIAYYDSVAEALLPHLRDRPIIMERYPNGIAEKYFLQIYYQRPLTERLKGFMPLCSFTCLQSITYGRLLR